MDAEQDLEQLQLGEASRNGAVLVYRLRSAPDMKQAALWKADLTLCAAHAEQELVLDMAAVDMLTSMSLAVFCSFLSLLAKEHPDLRLCMQAVSPTVQQLFAQTKIERLFPLTIQAAA